MLFNSIGDGEEGVAKSEVFVREGPKPLDLDGDDVDGFIEGCFFLPHRVLGGPFFVVG